MGIVDQRIVDLRRICDDAGCGKQATGDGLCHDFRTGQGAINEQIATALFLEFERTSARNCRTTRRTGEHKPRPLGVTGSHQGDGHWRGSSDVGARYDCGQAQRCDKTRAINRSCLNRNCGGA